MPEGVIISKYVETERHEEERKQCWECFRRRLVCGSERPTCKKCRASGIECPGYGEKKPLTWLAPGKVKSKTRKRQRSKTIDAPRTSMESLPTSVESGEGGSGRSSGEEDEWLKAVSQPASETAVDEIVEEIPRHDLIDDTTEFVNCVNYWNLELYPEMLLLNQLAPNPDIVVFPLVALHYMPLSSCHALTGSFLRYRMYKCPETIGGPEQQMVVWSRIYHHRGAAIRGLTEHIADDRVRTSDLTIASVFVFMVTELQQSLAWTWREHALGLAKLIALRGGVDKLCKEAPQLKALIVLFILIAVFGNTTSPPTDQIPLTSSLKKIFKWATACYGNTFPYVLCPPAVFLNIIQINELRCRAVTHTSSTDVIESTRAAADSLLVEIQSFSPEEWSKTSATSQVQYKLLGAIYQSAAVLYYILSLQSQYILPLSIELRAIRDIHSNRLHSLLQDAMISWHMKRFGMWPTIVMGVDAKDRGRREKEFITQNLMELSKSMGTSSPLLAVSSLKRFWAGKDTRWDDCFDRPYAFVC